MWDDARRARPWPVVARFEAGTATKVADGVYGAAIRAVLPPPPPPPADIPDQAPA